MRLGLGLYRSQLNETNYQFALQAGCSDIVAHLTDYFQGRNPEISSGSTEGWGDCSGDRLWSFNELDALVKSVREAGLALAAIENFSPKFWSDVLLDGPGKQEQMEGLKQLIRDAGKAGVPCIGYNFSIAGVYGWTRGPYARANAFSVGFGMEPDKAPDRDAEIGDGMVWNMRYRPAQENARPIRVSQDEVWQRLEEFLSQIIPVAEEAGVKLAAHPDDPPVEELRRTARLVNRPEKYDRLLDLVKSPANALELCLGSLQEMPGGEIYDHVRRFARGNHIGYIHFRNVKGKVPRYAETFVDEGDIDMAEIIRILRDAEFDGVLIPDHTPAMACDAPWHAGMAFALGYMRALTQQADDLGPQRTLPRGD